MSRMLLHLCRGGLLTFIVMMTTQLVIEQSSHFRQLIGIASGGDLMVHSSFKPTGGMEQRAAGYLRRQDGVPLSVLLA